MRANARVLGWMAAAIAGCGYAAFGLLHLSPWVAAWDEVDFVLALDRFDLLAMQPHAPGYPYFILGGRLMLLIVDDPVRALGLWNLLLACSSAYPVYRLARRWTSPLMACLATAAVLTLPMNWTMAVRPMSEGAALALLWWYLWTLVRLNERRTTGHWMTAAFAFGLLMGTRLSYAPFGVGLLLIWAAAWRETQIPIRQRTARAFVWGISAAAFQLLWLAGLAAAEGGLAGTISLLTGFGQGHFTEWGGGITQAGVPFGERAVRFIADNWLWTATFAQSAALAVLAAVMLAVLIAQPIAQLVKQRRDVYVLPSLILTAGGILTACALAYGLWALLGQNIAKPRHAAPLAALTIFSLAAAVPRITNTRHLSIVFLIVLTASQAAEGTRLVLLQHAERPAVYRLADSLKEHSSARTVVYTWEEERVLRYLNVPVQTRPIFTYDYFAADVHAQPSARILLTGSVWAEFRKQRNLPDSKVRRIAVYRSDPRLDPVYGTIVLYEWNRG